MRRLLPVLAAAALCAGCPGTTPITHVCLTCGDLCVDAQTDPKNCGACGTQCGGGQACVDGACVVSCGAGLSACGTSCTDTRIDPLHCGACGTGCAANQACVNGQCQATCGTPLSACSGGCVDTRNDPQHCGSCAGVCATGQACLGGACVFTCSPPQQMCGGACVSTATDRAHCGACGRACEAGFVCSGGQCQLSCRAGELSCDAGVTGSFCVTAGSDNRHCGACGVACGPFERCQLGACTQPLSVPRTCAEAMPDGGVLPRTVTLYVDGQPNLPFAALCGVDGGMYLPLAQVGDPANSSHDRAGGSCLGLDVSTHFSMVRLELLDAGVDAGGTYALRGDDWSYATTSGLLACVDVGNLTLPVFSAEAFGTAFDCVGDPSAPSDFNIDLRGTPFALGNTTWVDGGHGAYVTQQAVTGYRQVVNVRGGGACGGPVPSTGALVLLRSCPAPGPEVCDRLDNDCDGAVDDLADGGSCP